MDGNEGKKGQSNGVDINLGDTYIQPFFYYLHAVFTLKKNCM